MPGSFSHSSAQTIERATLVRHRSQGGQSNSRDSRLVDGEPTRRSKRFPDELAIAFGMIVDYPHIGARALNASLQGVRRLHLNRTGHDLYYRVTDDAIEVLAVWHGRRGADPDF